LEGKSVALSEARCIVRKLWGTMGAVTYRMIAIDLDGTLLSPEGKVTDRTKAAIHGCLSAGMLICFATGRNWTESRTVLDTVAHHDHAVFAGGAIVIDTKQEAILHRQMVDPQLAREVCKLLEDAGHAVLALQETAAAGVDYLVSDEVPVNAETMHWMSVTSASVHHVSRLSEYSHEHTLRLGIVAEPTEVKVVHEQLLTQFGERIFCHSIYVPMAKVQVLEIFDPAVNKWEGILHVARRHNVLPTEIIAIGDDVNDLPMLTQAGLGVAMGNAKPEVQAAAKQVIKSNREDGLAQFLEDLVRQHVVEPIDEAQNTADDGATGEAAA
jgi:5-amino-6-(5-phospho-D-ribitylamino)uracil phosphatase